MSVTGVASAIFTSLEEAEVLPLCEMKIVFWLLYWHQEEICEEVDLEELQFLSSFFYINNNEAEDL